MGNRIEYAIKESGTDVRTVARACGVSVQAVYSWMQDRTKDLRNRHLFALADATGFDPRWISLGEGEPRLGSDIRHAERVLVAMEPATRYTAIRLLDTLAEAEHS